MKYLAGLILILTSFASFAQNADIRGFMYDKSNGEPISYEKVKLFNDAGALVGGANTDINGLFSITKVNLGTYRLVVELFDYERIEKMVDVGKTNGVVEVTLIVEKLQSGTKLDDVQISAEKQRNTTQVQVSKISMDKATIERIPSIGGEPDIATA